jgi:hypothetical protein
VDPSSLPTPHPSTPPTQRERERKGEVGEREKERRE